MRRIMVLVLAAAGLGSCDRKPAAGVKAAGPAAMPAAAPTPNLDRLAGVFARIPVERLWAVCADLKPTSPGLTFGEGAPGEARTTALAFLAEMKPVIAEVLEVSKLRLEAFPPGLGGGEGEPDGHMKHPRAHVQNVARLLMADAARAVDEGSADEALERLAAVVRLAVGLLGQRESLDRLTGSTMAAQASLRVSAMAASKSEVLRSARAEAAAEVRRALESIDATDPAGTIGDWEREARTNLAECRSAYTGADGPEKYAAYLRQWGVDGAFSGLAPGDELDWLMPTKGFAEGAAKLTVAEISAGLDRAEAMIPEVARALKARDLEAARRAMVAVREDPTQVSRLVVGAAPGTLTAAQMAGGVITAARAALER